MVRDSNKRTGARLGQGEDNIADPWGRGYRETQELLESLAGEGRAVNGQAAGAAVEAAAPSGRGVREPGDSRPQLRLDQLDAQQAVGGAGLDLVEGPGPLVIGKGGVRGGHDALNDRPHQPLVGIVAAAACPALVCGCTAAPAALARVPLGRSMTEPARNSGRGGKDAQRRDQVQHNQHHGSRGGSAGMSRASDQVSSNLVPLSRFSSGSHKKAGFGASNSAYQRPRGPDRLSLVDRPARQVRSSGPSDNGTSDAHDLVLVKAIQAGDAGAWSKLLIRYQDRLFGVCMRMVGDRERAADLTQDAMVRIIEGIKSYDGRAKLSTWMIRVTMNVCLSKLRSEKLRRHASLDAGLEARSGKPGAGGAGGGGWAGRSAAERVPDEQTREPAAELRVEREETRRLVAAALLRILPEQRAILVLRDSKGLEYEQIAEVLDVPVGTVKSRLFRARQALREALESMDRPVGMIRPAEPEE